MGRRDDRYMRLRRGRWFVRYTDAGGHEREKGTGCSETQVVAARRIRDKILADAALRREGVIDTEADRLRDAEARAIDEHIDEYTEWCESQNQAARKVSQKGKHLRAFINAQQIETLAEYTPERAEHFLASLRVRRRDGKDADGRRRYREIQPSPATRNEYRASILAFASWCEQRGRIRRRQWKILQRDKGTEQRHERRPLATDELGALLEHAARADAETRARLADGGRRNGCELNARDPNTRLFYLAAVLAGLRRGDLAAMTWADLDLDADTPTLTIREGKAKRVDVLALHDELAAEFREARPPMLHPKAAASVRVFPTPPGPRTVREDFDAAGIAHRDEQNRVADLHSLRGTFATMLVRGKVPLAHAQRLMRHADIRTTMKHYAKLDTSDMAEAVNTLPSLATGTENATR